MGELQKILNIGPRVEEHLHTIGIKTRAEFLGRDPFELFDEMLIINPTLPKPLLASLVGAKENTPWYLIYDQAIDEYEKNHPNHVWLRYVKK